LLTGNHHACTEFSPHRFDTSSKIAYNTAKRYIPDSEMPSRSVSFRHFILGMLTQQPMSGYDIKRLLQGFGWLVGDASYGSLYPALHGLHQDGLVTVEVQPGLDKPPRKVYSITEEGRAVLAAWISEPQATNPSLKAFLMRLNLAGNQSEASLLSDLRLRRAQVAEHHSALQEEAGELDDHVDLGYRLTLNYAVTLAAAELAWLDHTLDGFSRH
jgi:PadR family transcriptional regulator AphA